MTFYERVRIVIAWCELRQAFRHFRTDRLTGLVALEERYPARRADLFRRWQKEEERTKEEWERCKREGSGMQANAEGSVAPKAFSSEMDTGSREEPKVRASECATKQRLRAIL